MSDDTEETEAMAEFFDARAAGYDDHQRYLFTDATSVQFHHALASPIERTDEPLNILDLGCGTGLELEAIFQRAPNAMITGVDLAQNMLDLLRKRYTARMNQITLVADSYLAMPFGAGEYDYTISAMANHHILRDTKRELYIKIRAALKPGGKYIEGDPVVAPEIESQLLAEYQERYAGMPPADDGHYHVDVPFSIDTQRALLLEAGFRDFELVWRWVPPNGWPHAVYVVTA